MRGVVIAGSAAAPGRPDEESTKDPRSPGWHQRGYLPHFDSAAVIQMVTYRLADALPSHVAQRLASEMDAQAEPRYRRRIEGFLDSGHGSCVLARSDVARIVIEHWCVRNGEDYCLHAWTVMPNHVHVLVQAHPGHSLSRIVGAWKSITARRIRRLTGGPKQVWQEDYWDRFIRDERHYREALAILR